MNIFSTFVDDYDRMIDWDKRLTNETPFYKRLFSDMKGNRILDTGCATGRHAQLFCSWGYQVAGADPSTEMIRVAEQRALEAKCSVDFKVTGLEEIDKYFAPGFDIITCMGNSIPHIMDKAGLEKGFGAAHHLLADGGKLAIQLRNYQRIYEKKEKFMPLNTKKQDGKEYLYLRMNELEPEYVNFSIVTMIKDPQEHWSYKVDTERLRAWRLDDLAESLVKSGFKVAEVYGSIGLSPFVPSESQDLIIIARRDK